LSISCAFVRLGDTSLTADYAVYIGDETEPVASGTCISVCIDAKTRQKVVVPDALRAAVAAFEGG
jgi:acyl-CoA thioesterase FadM